MGKILVIAEKPDAGADMAKVLGCTEKKKGYIEGDKYIITWAIGHLVGQKEPQEHDINLKKWTMDTLPFRFPIQESLKILEPTSSQFSIIKQLIHRTDVDSLINAGDAGREGYLIQEWIYRMAGNRKPVQVLWASSLTEEALKRAFASLHERSEFQNILQEAEARSEMDWLLGMNYSRALTLTKGQGNILLRYGRCQTSLLYAIVQRDKEIEQFISEPYYEVWRTYREGFSGVLVNDEKEVISFKTKDEAENAMKKELESTLFVSEYQKVLKKVEAPTLYNLAELQKDMGNKFGYDAEKTLNIAQTLYETYKILSYPRTDSKVMSTDLAEEIGLHLDCIMPFFTEGMFTKYSNGIEPAVIDRVRKNKKYVNDTKVTDHHALVPTINHNMFKIFHEKLNQDEKNVFTAILKRFLAIFYPENVYVKIELLAKSSSNRYYLSKGKRVVQDGWRCLYGGCEEEKEELKEIIPTEVKKGDMIQGEELFIKDKNTRAPEHYTVSSIISLMEKYNIGTSATRSKIIKKLMNPKNAYIELKKGKYSSTELGKGYIELLPMELKNVEISGRYEEQLSRIGRGELLKSNFLDEVYNQINDYIQTLKIEGSEKVLTLPQSAQSSTLICPMCGKRVYKGKSGWYCSGYKAGCKVSISYEICHKKLTDNQVKQLLEKGKTNKISGFVSKKGTTFSARLFFHGGKIGFEFGK